MQRKAAFALGLVGVAAVVVVVTILDRGGLPEPAEPAAKIVEKRPLPAVDSTKANASVDSRPPSRAEPPALAAAAPPAKPADVDTIVYKGSRSFRERLRLLVEQADSLGPDDRAFEAEHLKREIDRLEDQRMILKPQALILRTALLRVTAASEDEFREQATAMVNAAAEDYEKRKQAAEQALIESNAEYREHEAVVVRDIMASGDFPDEGSRQAALRERLNELRLELYERRR